MQLLMDFLVCNKTDERFEYPFGTLYPWNCCQGVSLIMTYLLEEKFDLDNVAMIKGTKPKKHEHHFWVMVGDLNYDLTAHQFPKRKPIIGALTHNFFHSFPEWQIEKDRSFVERDRVIEAYRSGIIPF